MIRGVNPPLVLVGATRTEEMSAETALCRWGDTGPIWGTCSIAEHRLTNQSSAVAFHSCVALALLVTTCVMQPYCLLYDIGMVSWSFACFLFITSRRQRQLGFFAVLPADTQPDSPGDQTSLASAVKDPGEDLSIHATTTGGSQTELVENSEAPGLLASRLQGMFDLPEEEVSQGMIVIHLLIPIC